MRARSRKRQYIPLLFSTEAQCARILIASEEPSTGHPFLENLHLNRLEIVRVEPFRGQIGKVRSIIRWGVVEPLEPAAGPLAIGPRERGVWIVALPSAAPTG